MRLILTGTAVVLCLLAGASAPEVPMPATARTTAEPWPDWDLFLGRFMQGDGRIIDITFDGRSTSEGQAYALFFALIANDRSRFDRILKWTTDNLTDGQLGDRLPAWWWGRREDGSWGVKDANAAADADLWLAYTLLEAGRLWNDSAYSVTGRRVLAHIQQDEVVQAGAAGALLLPGPVGFVLDHGRFRINPSYLPGFIFRYLALTDPHGPWQRLWDSWVQLAPAVLAAGVAPDRFVVDSSGRVFPDTEAIPSGSYDAIRVYLWAGMSGQDGAGLVGRLAPFAALIRASGFPPEKVNPLTGVALQSSYSPSGYAGAVLPFLRALGDDDTLKIQRGRVSNAALAASRGNPVNYYDQALIVFGNGWLDGRYGFDSAGRLQPRWAR